MNVFKEINGKIPHKWDKFFQASVFLKFQRNDQVSRLEGIEGWDTPQGKIGMESFYNYVSEIGK